MNNDLKSKIYQLVDSIEDENVLQMIMDEIAYYAGHHEILEELSADQRKELDDAISEADEDEILDWEDFNSQANESKRKQ